MYTKKNYNKLSQKYKSHEQKNKISKFAQIIIIFYTFHILKILYKIFIVNFIRKSIPLALDIFVTRDNIVRVNHRNVLSTLKVGALSRFCS